MKSIRRARPIVAAWIISVALALISASVAFADGGGTVFPR